MTGLDLEIFLTFLCSNSRKVKIWITLSLPLAYKNENHFKFLSVKVDESGHPETANVESERDGKRVMKLVNMHPRYLNMTVIDNALKNAPNLRSLMLFIAITSAPHHQHLR